MDFMTKSQPRLRTEFISYALDKALFEFASNGSPPTEVKTKFEHVTDFGCLQQPPGGNVSVSFFLYWHVNHIVQIQKALKKLEDRKSVV